MWPRDATRAKLETNGAGLALFAAGTTHDTVPGQAGVNNAHTDRPRRLVGGLHECTRLTGHRAGTAELAGAAREIDLRETTAAADQNIGLTRLDTGLAAGTGLDKPVLRQGPWRAYRRTVPGKITAEELHAIHVKYPSKVLVELGWIQCSREIAMALTPINTRRQIR